MYFKYPHSTIYMNNSTSFSNNLFLQWTGLKHYYFLKKNYSLSDQDSKGQQMWPFSSRSLYLVVSTGTWKISKQESLEQK